MSPHQSPLFPSEALHLMAPAAMAEGGADLDGSALLSSSECLQETLHADPGQATSHV